VTPQPARVGIFGGTFDPIHSGHLDLVRHAAEAERLTHVLLVTNQRPPHKPAPEADAFDRHAMVALATQGDPGFVADARELRKPGVSWTVDTLVELRREMGRAELYLIVGADSVRDLATWRRYREILELATVVATERVGVDLAAALAAHPEAVAAGRVKGLAHLPQPWRSSALRESLRGGAEAPAGALPEGVADYIRKHRLYATAPSPEDSRRGAENHA
jgi:nicotinate-nucleotide adenylyltransferase